jgi:hypothetical protein
MRPLLFTILISMFVSNLSGQITFSNIDVNLKTVKSNNSTELICTNSAFSIKFQLKQRNIQLENNFATVDSQLIQIAPLKINGYKKSFTNLSISDQKQLLESYSNYELDYFKNDLNVEVINQNNQWVITKSRQWLVWYFRVGNVPAQVDKKMEIQLFASTIIADKVLTINAPIQSNSDFTRAGLIVNEMMESLTINTTK